MFCIGQIPLDRPIALAPMEDVSDIPFRRICKERGADLVYTEFTNVEGIARNARRALDKIRVTDEERPVAIQLYGSNGESLERATEIATEYAPDFIDINCGCWVRKVANRGDGAGLLRDLNKFEFVVRSVINATQLPVTVKTRLGWDDDTIVIEDVARMLHDNGVQALTVHCRTRCQGYEGEANWGWLPRIKEAAPELPLIANGDIVSPEDVASVFDLGVDGVMIGRGAIANPWIFEQAKHFMRTGEHLPDPGYDERIELCIRHLKDSVAHRGPRGVPAFRKFYANYLKGMPDSARFRVSLMGFTEVEPIEAALRKYSAQLEERTPAGRF
jgi:tRNA-dihydrouridine synthase B